MGVWKDKQASDYGVTTVLQTTAMALMTLENLTFDEALEQTNHLWGKRLTP